MLNKAANDTLFNFAREKIRARIDDPTVADILTPTEFPMCTKRACLDTSYFETFNKPNVSIVDIKADPISAITPTGVATQSQQFEYDAMTGALLAVDIRGRSRRSLAE